MPRSYFTKVYLPALWIAMSVLAFASNSEDDEKEPKSNPAVYTGLHQPNINPTELEELRKIADQAFPLLPYEADEERSSDDQKANAAAQEATLISKVPFEILLDYIFPCMSSELLRLKETCFYFSQLLRLNEYCLIEARVPNIPAGLLRAKVCTTQDGILRLASLMGVCVADLTNWFKPDFLQAAFSRYQNTLPETLEGQSEEVLGRSYPVIKIALAAGLVNMNNHQDPVLRLLRGLTDLSTFSFNGRRLYCQVQLLDAQPSLYWQTLEELMDGKRTSPSPKMIRMARELLRAGKHILAVNKGFLLSGNADQKKIASQIADWYIRNPPPLEFNQTVRVDLSPAHLELLRETLHKMPLLEQASLGQPELAFEIIHNCLQLPDRKLTLPLKIMAFLYINLVRKCENHEIHSSIQQFVRSLQQFVEILYSSYWQEISPNLKFSALRLLMQAERRSEVQEAMRDLLQLMDPKQEDYADQILNACDLFKDLSLYHYDEELRALTHLFQDVGIDSLIPILCSSYEVSQETIKIGDVCDQTIKIDREWSIALLKALVNSNQANIKNKLDALGALAKYAPEELDNIVSHIHSLSYQKEDFEENDFASELSKIYSSVSENYYRSGNRELCHFYYQKMIQKMLHDKNSDNIETYSHFLEKLQKGGLNVVSIEGLSECDPFTFFSIISEHKDKTLE